MYELPDKKGVKGVTKTVIFQAWRKMISRCHNKKDPSYHDYGGRGIKVCKRWWGVSGFTNFAKDMGDKPSSVHSLERRNNNLGYSPDNCCWATMKEQNRNTRRTIKLQMNGRAQCAKDWATELNIPYEFLRKKVNEGVSLQDVVECYRKLKD